MVALNKSFDLWRIHDDDLDSQSFTGNLEGPLGCDTTELFSDRQLTVYHKYIFAATVETTWGNSGIFDFEAFILIYQSQQRDINAVPQAASQLSPNGYA